MGLARFHSLERHGLIGSAVIAGVAIGDDHVVAVNIIAEAARLHEFVIVVEVAPVRLRCRRTGGGAIRRKKCRTRSPSTGRRCNPLGRKREPTSVRSREAVVGPGTVRLPLLLRCPETSVG